MKTIKNMLRKSLFLTVIIVVTLILFEGCSSTKGVISFDSLKYPASMSAFLCDQNQNIVMKDKELETIHTFEVKKTIWSIAYGLVPLTKQDGISNKLNEITEQYNGDGIINLTVTIEQGAINKAFSFLMYLPSYIPIFPSSAIISVKGEVVKLKMEAETSSESIPNNNFISKNFINVKFCETYKKALDALY